MFAGEMRKSYALSLVQNFPELPKGRPFPRIAEADIVTGLHDRVVDPTKLNQGLAGLCGPAAFFYCVLNYKPELYVQYVIDLLTTGKARLGALEVKPGTGVPCLSADARQDRRRRLGGAGQPAQFRQPDHGHVFGGRRRILRQPAG